MRHVILLLLVALPALGQAESDAELCDVIVRRHASSVCRTNAYGSEDCTSDVYERVCAYAIVYDNGVERITCQTCTGDVPPPAQQDCWVIGENGAVTFITCDSPIVINTESDSYPLCGPENAVRFDLDADGRREQTSWTASGSPVAFLGLDRNHNGVIDDGTELFGNHTPGVSGAPSPNGFEALSVFDVNRDGVIDAADPVWDALLLWTDRNHNAYAESSELEPIAASGVKSISLDYRLVGRRDEYGNQFRYEGSVRLERGRRRIYDVFFTSPH